MRHGAGRVKTQQVELVAGLSDVVQPDDGLHGFALGEVVAERLGGAIVAGCMAAAARGQELGKILGAD